MLARMLHQPRSRPAILPPKAALFGTVMPEARRPWCVVEQEQATKPCLSHLHYLDICTSPALSFPLDLPP